MTIAAAASILLGGAGWAAAAAPSDLAGQVQTLLRRRCLGCHGPERARGGLRVDRAASLAEAVVPGRRVESALYARLREGQEARMPEGQPPLPAREIALVGAWIDAGAPAWKPDRHEPPTVTDHWAYRAPVRPDVPARPDLHPIDAFLAAVPATERRARGLGTGPAPTREALIRRVTLDLTGLPPTLAEVDAFLADARPTPQAYEALVDRLLASPHFGERWAVPWLDAARYADSNGYEKDGARAIWKYRDWVVAALNADMPYDRFTVEQLAGDLLPGASVDQQIATGFHRNTMLNEEAGVDPEEARWERLVDRVSTTAAIWLGSTLACAQCHDHKHDPFTQRDFYALLAYFEPAREVTLSLPSPAQAARLAVLDRDIAAVRRTLETWTPALGAAQERWEAELAALERGYGGLDGLTIRLDGGARAQVEADGVIRVTSVPARGHGQEVVGASPLARITGVRLVALPDARLPGGGPGLGPDGAFFLTGLDVEAASLRAPAAGWRPVPLAQALADDRPREEPERYAPETLLPTTPRPPKLDPDVARGWGVAPAYDGPTRRARQLVLIPAAPFGFAGGTRVRVRLRYGEAAEGEAIGRFRVTVTGSAAPAGVVAVHGGLRSALAKPPPGRSRLERDQLAQAYREVAPELAPARQRLAALTAEREALGVVSTLTMAPLALAACTPLRLGGSFARPAAPVAAALPRWLQPPDQPAPGDRLALARWLASDRNPLGARALVNRLWAAYLGQGLVETVEDLGHHGARPWQPALLDFLATELVRHGWRMKPLHRLIVTSAGYQQAARLRLEAEMVRDQALAIGSLLDRRVGGPPVFPPQPPGVFAPPNSTEAPWRASAAPDRHRRALYTFWRRSAPHPAGALFDAPSREVGVLRRPRGRTPLQALVTLNDPAQWEAAEALGRRMQAEPPVGSPIEARLGHGFRLATARRPRAAELAALVGLYRRQRARWPGAAGDGRALALVGNVLLNLDETLSR